VQHHLVYQELHEELRKKEENITQAQYVPVLQENLLQYNYLDVLAD
jgi:hypothetical protein